MLSDDNFIAGISNFSFENLEEIPIIGTVKVDNNLYGKLDVLINKHYNGDMKYLPLLLDFNKISDATEIKLNQILTLPDIRTFENSIKILTLSDDENIPGIACSKSKKVLKKQSNKTTALPKLKITLDKVSYDNTTGILKF